MHRNCPGLHEQLCGYGGLWHVTMYMYLYVMHAAVVHVLVFIVVMYT